jgi:DNA-directed RNA polymerase specialized sigma subunit
MNNSADQAEDGIRISHAAKPETAGQPAICIKLEDEPLRRAIASLNETERQVVELWGREYTTRQIEELTGTTPVEVFSILREFQKQITKAANQHDHE